MGQETQHLGAKWKGTITYSRFQQYEQYVTARERRIQIAHVNSHEKLEISKYVN